MDIVVIVGLSSIFGSALITYLLTTHFYNKKVAAATTGDDLILDLRLDQEFHRGKEVGHSEELKKFTLTYEPFEERIEEYLGMKKRSTLGYNMQIHYAGFPIGEPTRRITHNNIAYDEKRIEALLNSEVISAINGLVQLVSTKGMNTKVLPHTSKKIKT